VYFHYHCRPTTYFHHRTILICDALLMYHKGPYRPDQSAGNESGDRGFVQSSGPFTMEPGEVNDLTFGVVWARSYEGGLFASVDKMLEADDKAQALFDNCFRILEGPPAPNLAIQELENELIVYLDGTDKIEDYAVMDPIILACNYNNQSRCQDLQMRGY